MYLPEHEHVETQIQTRFQPRDDSAGLQPHRSSLYAPGQPHRGAIDDNWEVVVMLLEPRLMTQAADELFSRDRFEIKPFSLMRSPMAEQLTEAALGEFRSAHGPGLFYMESIGHVMSVTYYGTTRSRVRPAQSGESFHPASCTKLTGLLMKDWGSTSASASWRL